MHEITKWLFQNYDVASFNKKCNMKNCSNVPVKEFSLYHYSTMSGKKVFAAVRFCTDHALEIRKLMAQIKEIKPKLIIGNDSEEIKESF